MHLVQQVLKRNQDLSVFSDGTSHLFYPPNFHFKWLGREGNVTNLSAVLVHLKRRLLNCRRLTTAEYRL